MREGEYSLLVERIACQNDSLVVRSLVIGAHKGALNPAWVSGLAPLGRF